MAGHYLSILDSPASEKPPAKPKFSGLEARAAEIADPVERLKYLRQHAQTRPAPGPAKQQPHGIRWGLALMLGAPLCLLLLATVGIRSAGDAAEVPVHSPNLPPEAGSSPRVWKIESSERTEVYSNGLRIDLSFATRNRPRMRYPIYPLDSSETPATYGDTPRGVVYHTTESHLEPFEEESNGRLKYLGKNLLELLRREHSYHYLIDRFGRVYRVVEESDAANHSGNSVWADAAGVYVNLNDSFLGIAFEGQTEAPEAITMAQITAARMLTEMLQWRYKFPLENFVTHAQVSVNPLNMRMGAHTDWARDFPFEAVGLPDNYALPTASLFAFGFAYDSTFLQMTGGGWKGLGLAEDKLARQAKQTGVEPERYRARLQHRYKDIAAALKESGGGGM